MRRVNKFLKEWLDHKMIFMYNEINEIKWLSRKIDTRVCFRRISKNLQNVFCHFRQIKLHWQRPGGGKETHLGCWKGNKGKKLKRQIEGSLELSVQDDQYKLFLWTAQKLLEHRSEIYYSWQEDYQCAYPFSANPAYFSFYRRVGLERKLSWSIHWKAQGS